MRMEPPLTFISIKNTQIWCVGGFGNGDSVSGNGLGMAGAASPAVTTTWGDDVYGLFEREESERYSDDDELGPTA